MTSVSEQRCGELAGKIIDDGAPVYLTLLKIWREATEAAAKKCDARAEKHSMKNSAADSVAQQEASNCAAAIRKQP